MINHGDIHWVDLGEAEGGRQAKRRPVLIIQSGSYNASRLATVIAVVITSNTALASMPGNVFLPAVLTGLQRDSVVNVTALVTLDKNELGRPIGTVPDGIMQDIDRGLRQVLAS